MHYLHCGINNEQLRRDMLEKSGQAQGSIIYRQRDMTMAWLGAPGVFFFSNVTEQIYVKFRYFEMSRVASGRDVEVHLFYMNMIFMHVITE